MSSVSLSKDHLEVSKIRSPGRNYSFSSEVVSSISALHSFVCMEPAQINSASHGSGSTSVRIQA